MKKKKPIIKHLCDMCGKTFVGEKHKVYDENYNIQHGLIHCGCVFEPIGEDEDKIKKKNK